VVTGGLLADLRVLDLTRFVAGAQATALLASLGADVIKVEIPPGDPYRGQGTGDADQSPVLFSSLNSGKRSLALDFREPPGRAALDRLLATCDVLMENARPGSLARYGLDWNSVHERFPALIYGSISGYGDIGPASGKGGFDLILQAESGIMSVTGTPESGPVKVGAPLLDVGAGLSCALGVLAAYVERYRTGTGRLVSSSLLEFALTGLATIAAGTLASGIVPGLLGTHSPNFAPYGGFRTADGWLVLAGAGSEDLWRRACAAMGAVQLIDDLRFIDNARRLANRDELTDEIEAVLATAPTGHWLAEFERAGVPAAQVRDLAQMLGSPQVAALGAVQEVASPNGGRYRLIGPPVRIDREELRYQTAAPTLGADTRAVLAEAGLTDAEITELVRQHVAVAR
jgi:crotonobetainyl-CoA:carnitine CoA-transferase CaiB-like acyl-CoA transferase